MSTNPNNTAVDTAEKLESLWTWKEVAEYLKVSRSWVYQRAEANILPSLRIGGLLRFDPPVIRAFARGQVVTQAATVTELSARRK